MSPIIIVQQPKPIVIASPMSQSRRVRRPLLARSIAERRRPTKIVIMTLINGKREGVVDDSSGLRAFSGLQTQVLQTQVLQTQVLQTQGTSPAQEPFSKQYRAQRLDVESPLDKTYILRADRHISGTLETGINTQVGSDEAGTVVIIVNQDTLDNYGQRILLPKGSRMLCGYASPERALQTRIKITCERVLIAGSGAEILARARVYDVEGRVGISGTVDKRSFERYGLPMIITVKQGTLVTIRPDQDWHIRPGISVK